MIREATINDITAIIELGQDVIKRSPILQSPIEPLKARRFIRQMIASKAHLSLVAEVDNKVVGCLLGLCDEYFYSKDKYATDLAFYVDVQHGNQAPWLLKRFIKWAKTQPRVVHIAMGISTGLDAKGDASRMYQKLGFEVVGNMFTHNLGVTK